MTREGACGLALIVASALACGSQTKPVGGLVVVMELDPSLAKANLTSLHVGVHSPGDGGKVYRNLSYALRQSAPAGADAGVSFPADLPIESNGDPSASVVIELALWQGQMPIDVRDYEVVGLPTDRFMELVVVFSAACEPHAALVGGQAVSLCEPGYTCTFCPASESCNAKNGTCALAVIPASALPPYSADAGPPSVPGSADGGADATLHDASSGDAAHAPDEGATDAVSNVTLDVFDAGEAGDGPGDAIEPLEGAAPPVCNPACVEGKTHCVGGTCAPVPPSCAGHDPGVGYNCGGAFGSDDCCAWVDVAGGSFFRDYDLVTNDNHKDAPATVSPFGLDVYEVTVGRYRKFVDAVVGSDAAPPWTPAPGSGKHTRINDGGGLDNGGSGAPVYESGWDPSWTAYLPTTKAAWDDGLLSCGPEGGPSSSTWTSTPTSAQDGIENFPIDCVNWYQAYAFCIWDGGYLPSSSEWYRAAAPPDPATGQRIYAWGNNPPQPDCRLAIWGDYWAGGSFSGNGVFSGVLNIAPVGTASNGRGLWGQLDLTGNILEWTLDYWTGSLPNPCVDCATTAAGTQRIMRGGAFDFDYRGPVDTLANTYSEISPPTASHGDVGFRCARLP